MRGGEGPAYRRPYLPDAALFAGAAALRRRFLPDSQRLESR